MEWHRTGRVGRESDPSSRQTIVSGWWKAEAEAEVEVEVEVEGRRELVAMAKHAPSLVAGLFAPQPYVEDPLGLGAAPPPSSGAEEGEEETPRVLLGVAEYLDRFVDPKTDTYRAKPTPQQARKARMEAKAKAHALALKEKIANCTLHYALCSHPMLPHSHTKLCTTSYALHPMHYTHYILY